MTMNPRAALEESSPLRILLAEDSDADAELIGGVLHRAKMVENIHRVLTLEDFRASLEKGEYDVVLSDHNLGEWSGKDALEALRATGRDVPFIVVTATLGDEAAAEYIKQGASDYVLKDRLGRLPAAIAQALSQRLQRQETARLRQAAEESAQALRESEESLRLLLASTAEAICGVDVDGDCTFCNPATLQMLGYDSPQQLLGKNFHGLVHHSHADGTPYPSSECPTYLALQQGYPAHVDDEVLWRADGTSVAVEYRSHPIVRDSQLIGAVVTFLDISDRKRAEKQLRESEERYRHLFANN